MLEASADVTVQAQFDSKPDCFVTTSSTLPGFHLVIPDQACRFTLAQAARGVFFTYLVVVDAPLTSVTIRSQNAGNCPNWGVLGLIDPTIEGNGQLFAYHDVGFCSNDSTFVRDIPATTSLSDFVFWQGKNWGGPSDINQGFGAPFPPGDYTFHLTGRGTYQGALFTVEGTMPIHLDP
jgi:hypothetical protein